MKFACLGYFDEKKWATLSPLERETMLQECFAYDDFLRENGHRAAGGQALQAARTAKTLRWNGNQVVVTDGPYAETKEQLGGLSILEASDLNEAVEIMSRHPGVRLGGPFEIRPIEENSPCATRHQEAIPSQKIFVNLPVKNLARSIEFFRQLGFVFDPEFTNETGACMIVSDDIYVMLLTEVLFQTFTPHEICNANQQTEVLICLSRASRDEVDQLVRLAVKAGGNMHVDPQDHGFMYQHGFRDLDGHIWELIHLREKPSAAAELPQPSYA